MRPRVLAEQFFAATMQHLERLEAGALDDIRRAATAVATSVENGGRIWIAQTSHCLHGEATYRAGGFMAAHILEDPITIEPGDVVIEGTPAGTSSLAIDIALAAKARGATLIALTQLVFEQDPRIIRQHASGKRLHELADIVIDLGGSYGDGELDFIDADAKQTGVRIIPSSGITGMVAMWMIFADAVEQLLDNGTPPLMWQSVLVPGATERNAALRERYLATRLGYETLNSET